MKYLLYCTSSFYLWNSFICIYYFKFEVMIGSSSKNKFPALNTKPHLLPWNTPLIYTVRTHDLLTMAGSWWGQRSRGAGSAGRGRRWGGGNRCLVVGTAAGSPTPPPPWTPQSREYCPWENEQVNLVIYTNTFSKMFIINTSIKPIYCLMSFDQYIYVIVTLWQREITGATTEHKVILLLHIDTVAEKISQLQLN